MFKDETEYPVENICLEQAHIQTALKLTSNAGPETFWWPSATDIDMDIDIDTDTQPC